MRITSGEQLLQRLNQTGLAGVKLDGDQLKTRNLVSRLLRKVGDAFLSLTAGGRTTLRERSDRLHETMAEWLRANGTDFSGNHAPAAQGVLRRVSDILSHARAVEDALDAHMSAALQHAGGITITPEAREACRVAFQAISMRATESTIQEVKARIDDAIGRLTHGLRNVSEHNRNDMASSILASLSARADIAQLLLGRDGGIAPIVEAMARDEARNGDTIPINVVLKTAKEAGKYVRDPNPLELFSQRLAQKGGDLGFSLSDSAVTGLKLALDRDVKNGAPVVEASQKYLALLDKAAGLVMGAGNVPDTDKENMFSALIFRTLLEGAPTGRVRSGDEFMGIMDRIAPEVLNPRQ